MARTVAERFRVETSNGPGAALGAVVHGRREAGRKALRKRGDFEATVVGEIFNLEAFADLGDDIADACDLIARLAEQDALDRLRDVNGHYCAAVYDRSAHRLILITDRLATFPVHFWRQSGETVFATQLYTLIGDDRIPRRADPAALAQLFTMQRTVGRVTPLAGTAALPAACILEIDRDGVREKRYWDLRWQDGNASLDDDVERFSELFPRVIARQSRGTRLGLLLSGGIDSRMILAAAPEPRPSCWTTASYADNPELAEAITVADMFHAEHHALVVRPTDTLQVLDQTVIESGGLYPASTAMSAFLPAVGEDCDAALTGHGLDYTFRGYYLPSLFVDVAGSHTRIPLLRRISRRPTGREVLENLRQGPPNRTVDRIVRSECRRDWWQGQAEQMQAVLEPWLDSDEPYNAWDAFILHSVSKHYAFTGMMAVRAVCGLRMPAFDNELFEHYLSLSPARRCYGRMIQLALRKLSYGAARRPNSNTGFRADLHPALEVAGLFGRGALRRLGLLRRPTSPSAAHSAGSWQHGAVLYREDPDHRRHFQGIRTRLDGLCCGILDADGLAACLDEHLDGRANHTKLLRQLLTHDAWVRTFGITGHA